MTQAARDAFPELPDGAAVYLAAVAAASRPVEDLTITEFAERYRKVSAESGSPWPGDFRISRVPYLREPEDCLHPDHPARRVTARWAAQLGKSTAIENWFCYIVDQAPGSMMIVLPTLEEAIKFNRVKLQPTIDASPRIEHKVVPVNSRDEQASTTAFKRFAGGFAQIVNAGSSKGLQMVSIKYLAMDEVTGYPRDVDGRGSPRDQARARQKMYGDLAKEWQGSTPGTVGECAITEDFEAGDRRYLYVPCPHCSVYHPLTFDQMRGPADGLPAHFRCLACDEPILNGHKPDLLAGGEWIPTRVEDGDPPVPQRIPAAELHLWKCEPCEGRCRDWQPSYHLWAAYAPREQWADLWARWVAAEGDVTKLRTFYQQDLAEPYDPGGAVMAPEKIVEAARAYPYSHGVMPAGAGLLVGAADVQSYGIKWSVWAVGPREQYWLVDRQVFEGPPDQSDEPWIELADAIQIAYPTPGGGEKTIDLAGVDTGWSTDRVYRFCAGRPNVLALDGREGFGKPPLGTPVPKQIRDKVKRLVAKLLLYPVGIDDLKSKVVAGLANLVAGPAVDGAWPRNTLHLSNDLCDFSFAEEMTAERLVDPDEVAMAASSKRGRRMISAKSGRKWRKIAGRKNDWFDTAVYSLGIAWYLMHRMHLDAARWAELLVAVHGIPKTDDLFSAADEGPFARRKTGKTTDKSGPVAASRAAWSRRK
jgi:phage terminase large subunit GpA-like protein